MKVIVLCWLRMVIQTKSVRVARSKIFFLYVITLSAKHRYQKVDGLTFCRFASYTSICIFNIYNPKSRSPTNWYLVNIVVEVKDAKTEPENIDKHLTVLELIIGIIRRLSSSHKPEISDCSTGKNNWLRAARTRNLRSSP